MIRTNSIKAWFLAARPKTLTAAAVPVLLGIALAILRMSPNRLYPDADIKGDLEWTLGDIRWVPALLCLFFAWVMQIDSNLVNDYFDFKHGNDDETRLGPKRACAEGWITLGAMRLGIIVCTILGCIIGLPLILFGGWQMVIVGICCVIFCFLYTTSLSYLGLGDVLVLVFFGIVPVCCTYYLVVPEIHQGITKEVALASITCGMVVDTLLIVNNYRDHDNDLKANKKTLVVHIGKRNAERLYLALGIIATLIMIGVNIYDTLMYNMVSYPLPLYSIYIAMHILTFRKMKEIGEGSSLNTVLGMTARNIFVFGIVSVVVIVCQALA